LTENKILNIGLGLAMEFGKNRLKPIQERLAKRVPDLTVDQLNKYNEICVDSMNTCLDYVYKRLDQLDKDDKFISNWRLRREFKKFIRENYSWINYWNTYRLYSQSLYFAWHDGLDQCIISKVKLSELPEYLGIVNRK
jgi:hypothetical protein